MQVGLLKWIEPDDVSAIIWEEKHYMPKIMLRGGHFVYADMYGVTPTSLNEDKINALTALRTAISNAL